MELTTEARQAFVRAYAEGKLTLADLRGKGIWRTIQILSDLGQIGVRPPLAGEPGPSQESRIAGIARLHEIMRR